MSVNKYDVELRIVHKRTGKNRLVTRTEWAFDAMDACRQSFINVAPELEAEEEIRIVTKIGPSADLVHAAMADVNRLIEGNMRTLGILEPGNKK